MKTKHFLLICLVAFCFATNAQIKDTSETKDAKHVEQMPEYPGGTMQMMKFIQTNVKYPKRARKKGIQGKCFIQMTVMQDGSIDSVRVLKGVNECPECDAEAVRVIKKMPKWNPGRIDGNPVPVYFNIPINFILK